MFKKSTIRSLIIWTAATLVGTGCSPERAVAPTSEAPAMNAAASVAPAATETVPVVARISPLTRDISVTQSIGLLGGIIRIPEAGVTVSFPVAAVLQTTQITVTAYEGRLVAYGFAPHGIRFLLPVTVTQDMSMTTLGDSPASRATLQGAYTPNGVADIDEAHGLAKVTELLDVTTLIKDLLGVLHIYTASFSIQHFSGYILSGGRR